MPVSLKLPEWDVSKLSAIGDSRPMLKTVLTEAQVRRDIVGRARAILKRILPGAAAASLYITAQPNPRRVRKGNSEPAVVFSARESRSTADGYSVGQTAHITLSEGAVVKVVLTR